MHSANPQPMKRIYFAFIAGLFSTLSIGQNALNFDGVDDRVSCGNGISTQISGNSITLEAWIYPTGWQPNVFQGNIINKENNNPDYGYMLRCGNGGKLNFNIGNGSWHEKTTTNNVLTLNTWQHVAGTYDGSKMRLYVNGILVNSMAANFSFTSASQNLTIGNWSDASSNRTFIGSIDEARVWNVARSRTEILNSMNGELCSVAPGLVACYRLNEGIASGSNGGKTTTADFSNNNNNGTLSSFALTGSSSNWVAGSGITPGSNFVAVTASGCNDYRGPNGNIYDSTGVYQDTLQNIHGCDSVIETTLTIKKLNVGVTVTSSTMKADQNNGSYRWMDCNDNYKLVVGGTKQTFTPPDPNGSYAVQVSFSGCTDSSACFSLDGIGLLEVESSSIKIFPNPSKGEVVISHPQLNEGEITVVSAQGAEVYFAKFIGTSETRIKLDKLPKGVYILKVENQRASLVERLILK